MNYATVNKIVTDKTLAKSTKLKKLEGHMYLVMKQFRKSLVPATRHRCWLQAVHVVRESYFLGRGGRAALFACAVLGLVACAPSTILVKDVTQQEVRSDQFDCKQRVATMYGGMTQMGFEHLHSAGQDIRECMFAKGYEEVSMVEYEQRRSQQVSAPATQTPEQRYRATYTGPLFPVPTQCVGQGCVSAREEK